MTRSRILACATLLAACACHEHGGPAPVTSPPHPTCARVHPVSIEVAPAQIATPETPHELSLPLPLLENIIISGERRVWYTVSVCGGEPPAVGAVTHSTHFVDLDRYLDAHIAELRLSLPSSGCTTATIVLMGFDRACESPQTTD